MKIINTTRYSLVSLTEIARSVLDNYEWKERVQKVVVTFKTRSNKVSLRYLKRCPTCDGSVTVSLPRDTVPAVQVAHAVMYGLFLCDGIKNKHIPADIKSWRTTDGAVWLKSLPAHFDAAAVLQEAPAPEKPKPTTDQKEDHAAKKLAKLRFRQSQWTSKNKRAVAALKKITRQIKYYERILEDRTMTQTIRAESARWNV